MSNKVLFVDDEPNVLQALVRQHGKRFEVQTALGCEKGVQAIRDDGPFAVVVSDLRMPGMDGINFLSMLRRFAPETVRIMLTGQSDLRSEMEAVNEAKVFQFLTKPCPPEMLSRTIESALEQHRLIVAERELSEKALLGTVEILSEILSLADPGAFGRSRRICRYVQHMTASLKLKDRWKYETAAMLSQIGFVTVPPEVLGRFHQGQPLSAEENALICTQARLARDLVSRIPRLEDVAQIVAQQGTWSSDADVEDPVKIGTQILKAALDLDLQILQGRSTSGALDDMQKRSYPSVVMSALRDMPTTEFCSEPCDLNVSQLTPQMVTCAPIYARSGLLLLEKGQKVSDLAIARLKGFASTVGVVEPVSVIVPGLKSAAAN